MAISVPIPVKDFAALSDSEGIPISAMPELVGVERLISVGLSAVPGPSASVRLTGGGISRSEHDLIVITARHVSGSDTIVDKTWHVDPDDWWALTRAEEGDALSDSSNTAVLADPTDGSDDSLLVGRSNGGRALVMQGGWSNPGSTSTYMRIEAVVHDAGLLARRLDTVASSVSRVVTLQRRSATRPAAPTDTEVTYDGIALAIDQNSEWVGLDLTPTGPDPLWYTTTAFRQSASGWDHDEWAVYATSTTFVPEYSVDDGVTWSTTRPNAPPYGYRFRDADGVLHGPYTEGTPQDWQQVFNRDITGDNPVAFALQPALDWEQSDWIAFEWWNDITTGTGTVTQGNTRVVVIPSASLYTTALMTTGEQFHQVLLRMSDHDGSGYSMGNGLIQPSLTTWLNDATQQDQRLRLDFQGASMGLQRASRLVIRRGFTSQDGHLIIRML